MINKTIGSDRFEQDTRSKEIIKTILWIRRIPQRAGATDRSCIKWTRCLRNHADRSRKISLFSDSGIDDGWNHTCDFTSYFIDERSGWNVKSGRNSCSIFKQFPDTGAVSYSVKVCDAGKI